MIFSISIEHDLEEVVRWTKSIEKQLSSPNLTGRPADIFLKTFRGLLSGGGFAPITETTRRIRSERGRSGSTPLKSTGQLSNSIKVISSRRAEIRIGSLLRKAGFLRLGGITSGSSMIPGKRVVQRDYLEVTEGLLNKVSGSILSGIRG